MNDGENLGLSEGNEPLHLTRRQNRCLKPCGAEGVSDEKNDDNDGNEAGDEKMKKMNVMMMMMKMLAMIE